MKKLEFSNHNPIKGLIEDNYLESKQLALKLKDTDADKSAHDHGLYFHGDFGARGQTEPTITLGARYKNSEPSHLYEIELDEADCRAVAKSLIFIADMMKREEEDGQD